jgi:Spy/CpxP family protein refolding chaperone
MGVQDWSKRAAKVRGVTPPHKREIAYDACNPVGNGLFTLNMKKLILSLAVAACAAGTSFVQAQDEPPKRPATGGGGGGGARALPEERMKMLTSSLGLTQEQQDKIKKIIDDDKPNFEKLRGTPQEERRAKFRQLMQAQNDRIAEVLTPEQKDKFKAALANRGQGRRGAAAADSGGEKKEGEKAAGDEKK